MSREIKNTMLKECKNCKIVFKIPVCRNDREHCCSSNCKKEFRIKNYEYKKELRKKVCQCCNLFFYPRQYQIDSGDGKFCSKKCSMKNMIEKAHKPEANKKRIISYMKSMEGKFKSGENHCQWTGGIKASYIRRRKKLAEYTKKYRKNNPEKVREFRHNRNKKNIGRLPNGAVLKIGISQKWKCIICLKGIKNKYHLDHIMPIALGGKHEPYNLQLLCPQCNLKKSAKEPIKYMQSMGYLL